MNQSIEGRCFCGGVQLTVSGKPEAMGYCHCSSCRHWSAGPINAFTLWKSDAVRINRGEELLEHYSQHPQSERKWCSHCGGHVLTNHPQWGLVDVYAAIIPELEFQPSVHVHYGETMLPIHDGLPKFRYFPAEMGGSGETMAE